MLTAAASTKGDDQAYSERVALVRQINSTLHDVALRFAAQNGEDSELTFFCECGCKRPVVMTLAGFEAAGGAWLDVHRPTVQLCVGDEMTERELAAEAEAERAAIL
jgi:hypothetical protein